MEGDKVRQVEAHNGIEMDEEKERQVDKDKEVYRWTGNGKYTQTQIRKQVKKERYVRKETAINKGDNKQKES